jgi:diguanylate cyclase (GGDEF)-like protein
MFNTGREMQDSLSKTLKQAPLFNNFSDEELELLKTVAQKITVPENTRFILEDSLEPCFYLLLAGDLLVTKKGGKNEENVLAEISGIRIIGETGMLTGERRSASVKTIQSSTLLKFDADAIKKVPLIYTKILSNVAHELSRKLRETNVKTSVQIERTDVMKKTMTLDALTGAFNRLYLMDLLKSLEQHALRYNSSFAILMVDIDDFKKINDCYGHQIGDAALKAFVEVTGSNVRKPDCVCRYGGEEFLIILHNSAIKEALVTGERIREAVSHIAVPHKNGILHFTVSIGVSTFHAPYDSVEKLISRADEALYLAKEKGKNQVQTNELPPTTP